ncbi:unnamed protein product, partial [Bubo scandiacus]
VMNLERRNYETTVSAIAVTMETIRTSNMSVSTTYKIWKRQSLFSFQLMIRYLSYFQKTAHVTYIRFDEEFTQLCRKWVVKHSSQPPHPMLIIG